MLGFESGQHSDPGIHVVQAGLKLTVVFLVQSIPSPPPTPPSVGISSSVILFCLPACVHTCARQNIGENKSWFSPDFTVSVLGVTLRSSGLAAASKLPFPKQLSHLTCPWLLFLDRVSLRRPRLLQTQRSVSSCPLSTPPCPTFYLLF